MIPFTTTTATIERPASVVQDSREDPVWTTVATGVPCVLGSISGSEVGRSEVSKSGSAKFNPGVDVRSYDRIIDEITGDVFEAGFVQARIGFGLNHVTVELKFTTGASGG